MLSPGGLHYFNHTQKLFEIGENSTLAAITWGLGSFVDISYRKLFAELADDLANAPATSVSDVANRWAAKFWTAYSTSQQLVPIIARCRALDAKKPHTPSSNPPDPDARTKIEEEEFQQTRMSLFVGFCIGGYVLPDRTPAAATMIFDPLTQNQPVPTNLNINDFGFWGAPNIFQRLIRGADDQLLNAILASGQWNGTNQDLVDLVEENRLGHPILPIREAIDFVHVCIYSTIKALKFSSFSQICGGPIEIAVVTSDRKFRWVRHKEWDTAIEDGIPR